LINGRAGAMNEVGPIGSNCPANSFRETLGGVQMAVGKGPALRGLKGPALKHPPKNGWPGLGSRDVSKWCF